MIQFIRGQIVDVTLTDATVDVGGVGYNVLLCPKDAAQLAIGRVEITLHTHHHIREDAESLYGFLSSETRNNFVVLIGTHGVGPQLGQAILSTLEPQELANAVAAEDVSALCAVPGVGKKTAQRLIVELATRLDGVADQHASTSMTGATAPAPTDDLVEALEALGYNDKEIRPVLSHADVADGSVELSIRLRNALGHLGSNRTL